MIKNLFIVSAPLQILNAIEAKYYFKTQHNVLLLLYNSSLNETDYLQKINLLDEKEWDEIIYYDLGNIVKRKRYLNQVQLIKRLQKFSYKYLFAGDFGTIQQAIMANLKQEEIYLLDDGTASIAFYERLKDPFYFNKIRITKKLKLMRYLLANLQYKVKQNINFFTLYDLKPLPHLKVIQHDFSHLKNSKLKECKKDSTVYILGQKLSEVKIVTKKTYLQYIKKIIEKFDGMSIVYIPHRSEEVTDEYESLMCDNFRIKKDISNAPVEMSFINEKIYPSVIVSFFSSALFTLDKIFEESHIYAVQIKEEDYLTDKSTFEIIKNCYLFLEKREIEFLTLP